MSSHASFAPAQSLAMTKPIGGAATTNDIVSAHKSGKKKQSTAARLNALVDQFQAFYGGLEHDVIAEHEDQEDKLASVERYVLRLQKSLVVEQTRRIEMLDHVENNLKQQFEAVWVRNKAQMEALKPEIPKRIAQWHARLGADEDIMEEVCRAHRQQQGRQGRQGRQGVREGGVGQGAGGGGERCQRGLPCIPPYPATPGRARVPSSVPPACNPGPPRHQPPPRHRRPARTHGRSGSRGSSRSKRSGCGCSSSSTTSRSAWRLRRWRGSSERR